MKKTWFLCMIGFLVLLDSFLVVREKGLLGGEVRAGSAEVVKCSLENAAVRQEGKMKAKTERSLRRSTQAISHASNGDLVLQDCPLNEIVGLLSEKAELSFVSNPEIEGRGYLVTGEVRAFRFSDAKSVEILCEELAFQFGLLFYIKDQNLELLTKEQVESYQHEQWAFVLGDTLLKQGEEELHRLVQPYLSQEARSNPDSFRYDAQSGELFVTDTPFRLEKIEQFVRVIEIVGNSEQS